MTRINPSHYEHQVFIGHNPVDGKRLISSCHSGPVWARANADEGSECAWDLDLSLVSGIVGEWFGSFLAPDSKIAQVAKNIFLAGSGAFYGMREDTMYRQLYAPETEKLDPKDLDDQRRAYAKTSHLDEAGEVASLFHDPVINRLWKTTRQVSSIQPILLAVAPFLGEKLNDLLFSIVQTPSRLTWRLTYMFPNAFHGNFVHSMCKLGWLSVKSVFSKDAGKELEKLKIDLGKKAHEYSDLMKDDNGTSPLKLKEKSPLAAYFSMLVDRLKQHLHGYRNPEETIKGKIKRGELLETNQAERETDPSKTLGKGYVSLESEHDRSEIRRISLVNLTAPFCGAVGVLGSAIAEPLRLIWNLSGIKTGAPFLNFISSLRSPASFTNYFFKFFMPAFNQGRNYFKLRKDIQANPDAGIAARTLLANKKRRLIAGASGMVLTGLSFVDSVMNLFPVNDSSRSFKFIRGAINKLVNIGFVRFFSERRGFWGERELIEQATQKMLGQDYVTDADIFGVSKDNDEQFSHLMQTIGREKGAQETEQPYHDLIFGGLSRAWGKICNTTLGIEVA